MDKEILVTLCLTILSLLLLCFVFTPIMWLFTINPRRSIYCLMYYLTTFTILYLPNRINKYVKTLILCIFITEIDRLYLLPNCFIHIVCLIGTLVFLRYMPSYIITILERK